MLCNTHQTQTPPNSKITLFHFVSFHNFFFIWTDVFSSIQSSTATYGVVPFENSTYGTVTFTLDLLVDRESKYPDLLVCAELYLPVHHCLVVAQPPTTTSSPGNAAVESKQQQQQQESKIKTIYSHPAAFGQCLRYLSSHYPSAQKIEVSSTSKAAELVAAAASPNSRSSEVAA
ncbi:MAG: hypothetical protein Q9203_007077, partial [Teloschistes exilis]